jgi:hypothetical protein
MTRIEGVDPRRLTDDYAARVLEAQAQAWGAPLLNHLTYARRPSIFRGVRGMWTGLESSGLIDHKLVALLNRRVAALNGCEF